MTGNCTERTESIVDRIYREQLLALGDLTDFKRQLQFKIRNMIKEMMGQPTKK